MDLDLCTRPVLYMRYREFKLTIHRSPQAQEAKGRVEGSQIREGPWTQAVERFQGLDTITLVILVLCVSGFGSWEMSRYNLDWWRLGGQRSGLGVQCLFAWDE